MKINKKKKVIESFLVIGMLLILVCPLVSAFEISSLYGKTSVLKLAPGESKEVVLTLQSAPGDLDTNLKAEILKGSEIFTLVEGIDYSLPGDKGTTIATLNVEIPEETPIGTEYTITVKFSNVDLGATGEETVSVTTSTAKTINVKVVEKPAQETPEGISLTWWILGIVVVIVAILVAWFMVKSKKEAVPVK